jgi:prepilin-type N-terminal cleavage/methylation domain-containing protein
MPMSLPLKRIVRCTLPSVRRRSSGFSVIELIVVMSIIAIMVVMSVPYLINYRKVLLSDDQAMRVMDLMREANQLALTRRRTVRFQIDLTQNAALIIDENGSTQGSLIKKVRLEPVQEVRMDVIPSGVLRPNPPNYANAAYAVDGLGHKEGATTVIGNNVWMARFRRDGSVVDAGNNLLSANLYVWPPTSFNSLTPRNSKEVRAITIFGGSGAVRYWKYSGTTFLPN